jgi:hypothetical protein
VEVLVSLIKDLLMETGIRTIEVIFRIVDPIGNSSILIGHIAEIIIVVLVMGVLGTLQPGRIGVLKVMSIRGMRPILRGKPIRVLYLCRSPSRWWLQMLKWIPSVQFQPKRD